MAIWLIVRFDGFDCIVDTDLSGLLLPCLGIRHVICLTQCVDAQGDEGNNDHVVDASVAEIARKVLLRLT